MRRIIFSESHHDWRYNTSIATTAMGLLILNEKWAIFSLEQENFSCCMMEFIKDLLLVAIKAFEQLMVLECSLSCIICQKPWNGL